MSEWRRLRTTRPARMTAGERVELVCAWCRRVFRDGTWIVGAEPATAAATHGICGGCIEVERTRLRATRGSIARIAVEAASPGPDAA